MSSTTRSTVPASNSAGQRLGQIPDHDAPGVRQPAEEGLDVRASPPRRSPLGARTRRRRPVGPDRAEQREREGARSDPRLDHGRTGEDVGLGDDLRRVLRVDDRRAARHRHDEVAQQRAQREVLVARAVRDDGSVRQADQIAVPEHAVVRVQLAVGAQRDRVHAALGPGELHPVALAERTAGRCAARPFPRRSSAPPPHARRGRGRTRPPRPRRLGRPGFPERVGAEAVQRHDVRHADRHRSRRRPPPAGRCASPRARPCPAMSTPSASAARR